MKETQVVSSRGIAVLIAIVAISALAAGQIFPTAPARSASVWNVSLQATSFDPDSLTVNVGDTVVWTGVSGTHTVISDPGQAESWNSGVMQIGDSFNHTFTHSGNFTYYCAQHRASGMTGVVMVVNPVPEFPGYMAPLALTTAVIVGLLLERRWSSRPRVGSTRAPSPS